VRAARFHCQGEALRVEEVPKPEPEVGWAIVRVMAAGICRTELHFTDDGLLTPAMMPMTLGHEVAGVVERVDGDSPVRAGERAAVHYYGPCGDCPCCRADRGNLCLSPLALLAFLTDGGFAEYVKVPATSLVPLPEEVPFEVGATLGCSAATALHALRTVGQVRAGETVVIHGIGGIGLLMVQLAARLGARVIAVGRTEAKLTGAKAFGAELSVNALREDVSAAIRRATGGLGADLVCELVGSAKSMADSLAALRRRGRLVLVGYSPDSLTVHPIPLVVGELTVIGSVGNTRAELVEVVELTARGQLVALIDSVLPLEEINEALDRVRRGQVMGRVVVRP
jgi:propanol-preferring alcohol dehydrogenase